MRGYGWANKKFNFKDKEMAYLVKRFKRSAMKSVEVVEGETIEQKIERIVQNKEPIKDGAPEIYTERKDGVISAYNIRTDRWELAADAMDAVQRSIQAKREERQRIAEGKEDKSKVIDMKSDRNDKGDGGAKPIQGKPTADGGGKSE